MPGTGGALGSPVISTCGRNVTGGQDGTRMQDRTLNAPPLLHHGIKYAFFRTTANDVRSQCLAITKMRSGLVHPRAHLRAKERHTRACRAPRANTANGISHGRTPDSTLSGRPVATATCRCTGQPIGRDAIGRVRLFLPSPSIGRRRSNRRRSVHDHSSHSPASTTRSGVETDVFTHLPAPAELTDAVALSHPGERDRPVGSREACVLLLHSPNCRDSHQLDEYMAIESHARRGWACSPVATDARKARDRRGFANPCSALA
jgi:hypothetical protein